MVWLMMIAGFAITAGTAGYFLDPFTIGRLIVVTAVVCLAAMLLTLVAISGVEKSASVQSSASLLGSNKPRASFREALTQVWSEPAARHFTVFVFVSMLAYSAQDLILEPFAGIVFGLTPGQSTQLSGVHSSGLLVGMLLVAVLGSGFGGRTFGSLRIWIIAGCIGSAAALTGLAIAGLYGPPWPLNSSVFALGFANGTFAVAAIGSMMAMAGRGRAAREGTRMGLWGAAQAFAFGLGGFLGTAAVDLTRFLFESPVLAYASVFSAQAMLFLYAALLAMKIEQPDSPASVDSSAHPHQAIQQG